MITGTIHVSEHSSTPWTSIADDKCARFVSDTVLVKPMPDERLLILIFAQKLAYRAVCIDKAARKASRWFDRKGLRLYARTKTTQEFSVKPCKFS